MDQQTRLEIMEELKAEQQWRFDKRISVVNICSVLAFFTVIIMWVSALDAKTVVNSTILEARGVRIQKIEQDQRAFIADAIRRLERIEDKLDKKVDK